MLLEYDPVSAEIFVLFTALPLWPRTMPDT